jgi:hypothetical protein
LVRQGSFLRGKGVQEAAKRYNVNPWLVQHYKTKDTPSSKSTVNTSALTLVPLLTSILTDPRLEDKDYLFFDDDPFQASTSPFSTMSLTSIPAWLGNWNNHRPV